MTAKHIEAPDMRLPRLRFLVSWMVVGLAVLALARAVGQARGQGQSPLKEQLGAARERHQRAVELLNDQGRPPAERAAARARYEEERRRDLGGLLEQVRKLPDDPSAVQAIEFIVFADHDGRMGLLDRAIEVLTRDHSRRPGIGQFCMFVSSIYYSPAVEPFIRAVLANHPDRWDRARACHALATMLRIKTHYARHFRKYPAQIEE